MGVLCPAVGKHGSEETYPGVSRKFVGIIGKGKSVWSAAHGLARPEKSGCEASV